MKSYRLPALVALLILLAWEGIVDVFKVPNYLVPAPHEIASIIPERLGDLWSSFLVTGGEALGGFILSIIVGLVIGMFFSLSSIIRRCFYPYIVLLQTIPIIAISPLILLWLGNGSFSILFISFIISLPAVVANATQGLISVDPNLLNLFRMGNASTLMTLKKLRFPNSLPNLFVGMKIAAGASVVGALVGETFAGSSTLGHGGLGYSSVYALSQLDTPYLFTLVMASSIMGLLFFFTVVAVERLVLRNWHESVTHDQPE
jgi:NitT/TauT family transport system permease protein